MQIDLGSVTLRFAANEDAPVRFSGTKVAGGRWISFGSSQPMVELNDIAGGRHRNNPRFTHTGMGHNLRLSGAPRLTQSDNWHELEITQRSEQDSVDVVTRFRAPDSAAAVEVQTTVLNWGEEIKQLTIVPTVAFGFGFAEGESSDQIFSIEGYSEQLAENRWLKRPVRRSSGVVDFNSPENRDQPGRGSIRAVGHSTWPTSAKLPVGGLINEASRECVLWQVESNTGWMWEIDDDTDGVNMLSVVLSGPTDLLHDGLVRLQPGQTHSTKRVGVSFSTSGFDQAIAQLTRYRRAARVDTMAGWDRDSVIFNDYMNTLNGDPSTEKLLPLIDAASAAGAEVFCVDCGWYDDTFSDWWSTVGEWSPSKRRFPNGIQEVLDRIRDKGMRLGLWLEPEVVGVNSVTASSLPDEMFMTRGGQRISEHQRYFLDYRNHSVRQRMLGIFKDLIVGNGIEYFKLDYNVTPGLGFDAEDRSLGQALRESGEAYLAFIDNLRQRFPQVTFESCSSGAMRADPETLRHFDLQSTSDQEDFLLYPTIAVGAPMSMTPEQSGNWAYIQPWMTDAEIVFTLLTGMSGRLYLSGFLSKFSPGQMELAQSAVKMYKGIRSQLVDSVPRWPLGFPGWSDPLVVFSRVTNDGEYLYIWKRANTGAPRVSINLAGESSKVERMLFDGESEWEFTLRDGKRIDIDLPGGESAAAVMLRVS